VLTYKALNGHAPPSLSSASTHVADMPSWRRLRSASTDQLLVPSYRRLTIGRRAFPIAGERIWNGLPSDVTSAPSLAVFGRRNWRRNFFAAATMLLDCWPSFLL